MGADPLSILAGTADAAFGTDEESRIVIWNRAAERLLGYAAASVLSRRCCEILCGYDVFGNPFCRDNCVLNVMVRRREGIHRFEMDVRTESGRRIRMGISVVVVPGPRPSQYTIVHLLQPLAEESPRGVPEAIAKAHVSPVAESDPIESLPLSAREVEVLRMLADGATTREIADALFISVATVRNHTQNILRKLDVHSKTEAVSLALRNRLI